MSRSLRKNGLLSCGAALLIAVSTHELLAQAPARPAAPRATTKASAKGNTAAKPASGPKGTAASTAPAEGTPAKSEIMAVVNGQSISRKELAKECIERYGEPVLESLVNKQLILEACRKKNIHITPQDIEQEISQIASRFNLPVERWIAMLQQERNISAEQYRRDIIWPTLALKQLAADQLTVSDADLAKEMEAEYGPKVRVRMIAVSTEEKARQVWSQAKAHPDQFDKLAKTHSEDPNSAAARGMIPPIGKHAGDPAIEKAVFALKPNEVSEIVPAAGQFLIFKCEKHLPPTHISPQYQKTASDQIRERLVDRNLREASGKIFQGLQSQAKVVNVMNDPKLREAQPGVAATINGQSITLDQLGEECLARHGRNVLDGEINALLLKQALQRRQVTVQNSDLDAEVARAAESFGYVNDKNQPDVERWLAEVTQREDMSVETYMQDAVWPSVALKKLVQDNVKVTEDDMQKGFEANYGERIEVLAIVVGNQRVAQEVWDMARANLTPKFFGELAAQYSIEPVSRANMGEVPPIQRYSGQPKVEEEAFALTKNDPLSAIVAVADRYIIMYYLGRTEPLVRKIDDVREELSKEIHEKKLRLAMSEQFDRIKEQAQIDNFLAGTSQAGAKSAANATGKKPAPGETSGTTAPRPARSNPPVVRPASVKKTP